MVPTEENETVAVPKGAVEIANQIVLTTHDISTPLRGVNERSSPEEAFRSSDRTSRLHYETRLTAC